MLTNDEWKKRIFEQIKIFSDFDFQKRVWGGISANGWEVYSSWAEHMCKLFDDSFFEEFINEKWPQFGLSENLYQKLIKLKYALDKYNKDESLTDKEIVNDPEWIKITEIAKEACEQMKKEI